MIYTAVIGDNRHMLARYFPAGSIYYNVCEWRNFKTDFPRFPTGFLRILFIFYRLNIKNWTQNVPYEYTILLKY